VNRTFDELQQQNCIIWTAKKTLFSYSVFVIWKTLKSNEQKEWVIMNIRNLNAITIFNIYLLLLQTDITAIIKNVIYISVVNCASFFYQWHIHLDDQHKFIIVMNQSQKSFNVTVINFKNSSIYIQRQINHLLCSYWAFAHIYVNGIVFFFQNFKETYTISEQYIQFICQKNIFIKSSKTFLDYFTV